MTTDDKICRDCDHLGAKGIFGDGMCEYYGIMTNEYDTACENIQEDNNTDVSDTLPGFPL